MIAAEQRRAALVVARKVIEPADRAAVLDSLGITSHKGSGRREEVVQAALQLVNRGEALTLRAVGRQLGTTAKVVERHFPTIGDLQHELALRVLTSVLTEMAAAESTSEMWSTYRALAIDRPGWHAVLLTSKDALGVLFATLDQLVLGTAGDRPVAGGHLTGGRWTQRTAGPSTGEASTPLPPPGHRRNGPAVALSAVGAR